MDDREASAMTEASGLTSDRHGHEAGDGRGRDDINSRRPLLRASERLRKITLAAPLPSLFAAFLLGVWVARRR